MPAIPAAATWQTGLSTRVPGAFGELEREFSNLAQMRENSGRTLFAQLLGAEPVAGGQKP